eukprot:1796793-Alexandrium_andersonii.AAC.1
MVQGQPDGRSVSPVRRHGFDLPLAQGTESQGMQLPCNAKGHDRVPTPGQPGCATDLVAAAGPKGKSSQPLH